MPKRCFLPLILALLFSMLLAAETSSAQQVLVQNGATVEVKNSSVWHLQGGAMDFGPAGTTNRLRETSKGRVAGGTLTATRALGSPSQADPAGLGAVISASVDLGNVTVTRGHDVQTAPNGNESIERYYDISPSGTNSGLNATLTHSYEDAELGGLSESNLELFKSDDGGSTWSEEGYDSRDQEANTVSLSGISSFSRWTLGSESAPLPVELAAFEGTVTDRGVKLTWRTASEANNAGFAVERSSGDKNGWRQVGFVDGAGTASEPRSYAFADTDLPYSADTLSYRLRQVDVGGAASVSEPIRVGRTVDEMRLLGPYPNPARSQATVRFAVPERQNVTLQLYDALGREVRTVIRGQKDGRNEVQIGLTDLPSGVYFLRLTAGDQMQTQRVTVVR